MYWTHSLVVLGIVALVTARATANALPPCVGDCDRSGTVEVGEIVRCVAIALGIQTLESCESCDGADGITDGQVGIEELTRSVAHALEGCGRPDGAECIFRTDCRNLHCVGGFCCDEECESGTCIRPDRLGICTPLLNLGDRCTIDLDCLSDICDPTGVCCEIECGIPCRRDGHCWIARE